MVAFLTNSFQIPNAIVDEALKRMSANAFKCYALVMRKTRGWGKESDCISISQFKESCGIKKAETAQTALLELEQLGLILAQRRSGKITRFSVILPSECTPIKREESEQQQALPKKECSPENGEYPHPKKGGTTTPENGVSTKYNTKTTLNKEMCVSANAPHTPIADDVEMLSQTANSSNSESVKTQNVGGSEVEVPKLEQANKSKKPSLLEGKTLALQTLAQFGIEGQLAQDYIAHRKTKRATVSVTALNSLKIEAQKANMTLESAMTMQIENGWQGFKADWILERMGLKPRETGFSRSNNLPFTNRNRQNQVPKHGPEAQSGSARDVLKGVL